MIVVDSSVWIGNLRNSDSAATRKLRDIDDPDEIALGDVILLEVLQGARDEPHACRIERDLRQFTIVSMLDEGLAIKAAEHYRELRLRGITLRKTSALIIGTFCLELGHTLLHDNRDFLPMIEHLGLRTL